jgi:hydroxymethylpyrimidine pyrophosphatase-like HAD family hydrolase
MTESSPVGVPDDVRLVVADVDGTLVTPDKILTPWARAVVRRIIEAGIGFSITSGRPPLGMKVLIDELHLEDPITAFNGGLIVRPDLSVMRERLVPGTAAQPVIDLLRKHKLDVWVYGDKDWYVTTRHGLTRIRGSEAKDPLRCRIPIPHHPRVIAYQDRIR